VEDGETNLEVPVTVPMPWSMDRLVAPLVLHLSVELPPGSMVAGLAVNFLILGAGVSLTVTVAVAVTDPKELVAVSV
jgi:hypothetical protein